MTKIFSRTTLSFAVASQFGPAEAPRRLPDAPLLSRKESHTRVTEVSAL
jgi:hypothetical protein